MALIDEITQLRDDSLSSLDAGHDYYVHTKRAWRLVQNVVRRGAKFTVHNRDTGSRDDESTFAGKAQSYVTGYLASATLQHFVSLFEQFMFDLSRLWLTEFPESLKEKQLKFQTVVESPDKDAIVAAVVQEKVHGLMYKRVDEWFNYIEKTAGLGSPSQTQIEQLAEIKALRNVLVHNGGIANSIYIEKSMGRDRFAEGDTVTLSEDDIRDSWKLIKQVVADIVDAGINKLGNEIATGQ